MSDLGPELPDDEALAAEHALGVLSARERAQAEVRIARDPAFAADVEAWRSRLAPLADEVEAIEPSAGVWPRIERAVAAEAPSNDNAVVLRRRLTIWRSATVGSLGLAAASLAVAVMFASRPPLVIQTPPPPASALLNANLATTGGQPLFVAAYDPDRQALIITSLVPPGTDPMHVHQLWLIPADGKPRSLGMVEPGKSKRMAMGGDMAPMVAEGAQLAVSVEGPGGSHGPGPSGPVAAVGKLGKI